MDKISIFMPPETRDRLYEDAKLFEVLKKDGRSINPNRLINLLVVGYHQTFAGERDERVEELAKAMRLAGVDEDVAATVAQGIESQRFAKRGKERLVAVPFKPSKLSEGLVMEISQIVGSDDTTSRHLCRMAMSYCERPSAERERIIHSETNRTLERACSLGQTITFTTTRNREVPHVVLPYKMAVGQGEQFNYLLCQEEVDGVMTAMAYRLCRVFCPHRAAKILVGDEGVERHLRAMVKNGAQYAINSDEECCVRLTDEGVRAYGRVYHGRPPCASFEPCGEDWLYRFDCSENQLFLYFRRFGAGQAEVLSPASLRERIIAFHEGALEMYRTSDSPMG